jgi:hypothetical protein
LVAPMLSDSEKWGEDDREVMSTSNALTIATL